MAIFQSLRSDGSIQFDASMAPYCFRDKGSVATISTAGSSPHWAGSALSSALIPMNYDSDEIIALYMPGYGYARYANLPYNNNWYHIFHTSAPVGTAITFYRFMIGTNIGGNYGPGLELFNEAGQRTFHSGMRPAIVAGSLSGLGASMNLPGGRQYASIVQTQAGHERTTYDGGRDVEYDDKGRVTGRYWTGASDSKLYGVQWNSPTSPSLVQVSFNDQAIRNGAAAQPANSEFYHNEIENALFVDVTGI